jgi:invasion protein IalB
MINAILSNRLVLVLAAIVSLAAVGGIAYNFGYRQGVQSVAAAPPLARPAGPQVTRLPPKRFGNWTELCALDAQQEKHCRLLFQVVDKSRQHLVLRLVVARGPKGRAVLVAFTPPNAVVRGGISVGPGTAQPLVLPFLSCGPGMCRAGAPLSDDFVNALSSAPETTISYQAGTGRPVSYKLPTQGFAAAYSAWAVDEPPPPVVQTPPVATAPAAPHN